jgi:phosphate starvation-inducible PhoH-like protein
MAWTTFKHVDVLFLLGPAGVGKSFMAMSLAIREVEQERAEKIAITRPIIESEESLGYLPGDMREKTDPYMMPLYDQVERIRPKDHRDFLRSYVSTSPLAYMRGRTFVDTVCIFDEAQNANTRQLKLYLSRLGEGSKMIITGDPTQSDVRDSGLLDVARRLRQVKGVGVIVFDPTDIVRHPVVEQILGCLDTPCQDEPVACFSA